MATNARQASVFNWKHHLHHFAQGGRKCGKLNFVYNILCFFTRAPYNEVVVRRGASFSSSNVQFNLEDFRVERTSEASSCKLELFKLIMDRQDRQAKSYRRDEHQSTYNAIYTKREFDEDR